MELVNLRVVGVGAIPELQPRLLAQGVEEPEPAAMQGTRRVVFESAGKPVAFETRVIRREGLKAGNRVIGPAIVQQMDTTTVIPPGISATVDACGNLIIRL